MNFQAKGLFKKKKVLCKNKINEKKLVKLIGFRQIWQMKTITYCAANSLVGVKISTLIAWIRFGRKSRRSNTGREKAAV